LTLLILRREQEQYRIASWQPSLTAGGPVDLSKTFTPTAHGTFSFGGTQKKASGGAEKE
jgi:hypothetical protein